jgi:hypothetical protein
MEGKLILIAYFVDFKIHIATLSEAFFDSFTSHLLFKVKLSNQIRLDIEPLLHIANLISSVPYFYN